MGILLPGRGRRLIPQLGRAGAYRIGPLPRTGAAAARSLPAGLPLPRPAWLPPGRVRDAVISAGMFAALLLLLTSSRVRRAEMPDRQTVGLALGVAGIMVLSRLRRWRARQAPVAAATKRLAAGGTACLTAVDALILAGVELARPAPGRNAAAPEPHAGRIAPGSDRLARGWEGARGLRRAAALKPYARPKRGGFVQLALAQIPSLVAVALVGGVAVSFGWLPVPRQLQEASRADAAPRPAPLPASAALPEPPSSRLPKVALDPIATGRTEGPGEPYRIAWPYDITDGLTFGPEGAVKTRLAGLEGPPRDAVCNDRDQRPWACGLQARAALNNITRRQALLCQPAGAPQGGVIPARCSGEIDVARELVLAGFARTSAPDPRLEQAEDEARQAGRGMWNGAWTVRIAGR
ncbi:MAG: hypothetical protein JWR08_1058 [Enterovirga sp.]|nr:hypothetical protein [Enterovirga sp.]